MITQRGSSISSALANSRRIGARVRAAALSIALAGSLLASARVARAESATELVLSGERELAAGRAPEACAAFSRARELDPASVHAIEGLVACNEKQGKSATAWRLLGDLASAAERANDPATAMAARQRALELEPRVPRVTIVVHDAASRPGLRVSIDDASVDEVAWGSPLTVDPGRHRVRFAALGYTDRWVDITVGEGEKRSVEAPPLSPREKAPTAERPPSGGVTPSSYAGIVPQDSPSSFVVPGAILVSIGAAGILLGSVTGGLALAKADELAEACPTRQCPEDLAVLAREANTFASISTTGFVVGGLGAAIGTVMLLSSGSDERPSASDQPKKASRPSVEVGVGAGTAVLRGRF